MRRSPGTGSVYQPKYKGPDGETRRQRLWWISYRSGGQTVREATGTASKAEAEKLLRQRMAVVDAGKPAGPAVDRTRFATLERILLDDYRANRRRSLKRAEQCMAHLRDAFEGDLAKSVTSDRVTAYAARRLEGGAKPATINRELAALKRAFRLAHRAGRVARVPHIQLLEERNTRQGFFEAAQFKAVMRHLPAPEQLVVLVAYETGWRVPSELLTRQWRHVDLRAGWLRLEPGETKNSEGRQFPLTPTLKKALQAQRRRTRTLEKKQGRIISWVFHREGEPIRVMRKPWEKACRDAGCPGKLLHDFRRTAVRNLERAGVSRSAAMAMVGHKTQAIYSRYAITSEADLKEAAAKLAKLR